MIDEPSKDKCALHTVFEQRSEGAQNHLSLSNGRLAVSWPLGATFGCVGSTYPKSNRHNSKQTQLSLLFRAFSSNIISEGVEPPITDLYSPFILRLLLMQGIRTIMGYGNGSPKVIQRANFSRQVRVAFVRE